MDLYGFYKGKILDAYEYLGCHTYFGGATFRTYAPNAQHVSVSGDFSNWEEVPMFRTSDNSIWECSIQGANPGMKYKYNIYLRNGSMVEHTDPYAFAMEPVPNAASIITDLYAHTWEDDEWMRKRGNCWNKPMNVYEIHMGSWKKPDEGLYTYKEIAKPLIDYVKEAGYNYIEIMPLGEHPCTNSWGYQQTGFYSPTSRYGTPEDLKYFIEYAHANDIGVILDFVPVHFAVDAYGLANYDGTPIYEYPSNDIGYNEWGSKNFNHCRGEVQSFLASCARYWLKEFHFDGLRMDALSNIIYWQGNSSRGVNRNAVEFIKHMNKSLKTMDLSIILIAEDSTTIDKVTDNPDYGGLGFDYKWDMGWMNDTLSYFQIHPYDRMRDYHKLTFSMMYYYNEHFMLPLSHDEVVHGKATILQKMNGDYDMKFPQARALYMYMYTHPGKKLTFMGNEFGQLREWDEEKEQDWFMLKYPIHDSFYQYIKKLNHLYLNNSALYERDYTQDGFQWVDCHREGERIYVYERRSSDQTILVLLNLSDAKQTYHLEHYNAQKLTMLLSSDNEIYSGSTRYDDTVVLSLDSASANSDEAAPEDAPKSGSFDIELNAFTGIMYLVE
ncbi:MAG: 1,4-alpha-glucan branching protein GlgB [Clostridia bacterium]|nr:1,4-alpha-glucan branching protein GlgB [Clostridia bacterium]